MFETTLIGLDLATKKTGLFVYNQASSRVTTFNGSQLEQLNKIISVATQFTVAEKYNNCEIIIEKHVSFRNANVTRVLIMQAGFIFHSLQNLGYKVSFIWPYQARRRMKDKYLEYTKDERDSILLIHEHLQVFDSFSVTRF